MLRFTLVDAESSRLEFIRPGPEITVLLTGSTRKILRVGLEICCRGIHFRCRCLGIGRGRTPLETFRSDFTAAGRDVCTTQTYPQSPFEKI